MTVPITPVNNFETSINIPAPGEGVTSAAIALGVQANANRSENNNSRLNDIPQVNTVTNYLVPILGYKTLGTTHQWIYGGAFGAIEDNNANASPIFWDINVPPVGSTIDSFTIYCNGQSGRADIPQFPPVVQLYRYNKATNAGTLVASATDPSGFVAYELDHTIPKTGIGEIVLADEQYQILVFAEDGTNATANLFTIFAIEIGWTYP